MNNVAEIQSDITKHTASIQRATGDKVGQILFSAAITVAGFFFAFLRGWYLSLLLLCGFPVVASIGFTMAYLFTQGVSAQMKAYS